MANTRQTRTRGGLGILSGRRRARAAGDKILRQDEHRGSETRPAHIQSTCRELRGPQYRPKRPSQSVASFAKCRTFRKVLMTDTGRFKPKQNHRITNGPILAQSRSSWGFGLGALIQAAQAREQYDAIDAPLIAADELRPAAPVRWSTGPTRARRGSGKVFDHFPMAPEPPRLWRRSVS
jgi:hypothetical protein